MIYVAAAAQAVARADQVAVAGQPRLELAAVVLVLLAVISRLSFSRISLLCPARHTP